MHKSKPNIPVPKSPRPLKNRPTNPNPGPKTLLKNFYLSISIYLSIAYIKDKGNTKPDTPKPINLTAPNPVPFTQKAKIAQPRRKPYTPCHQPPEHRSSSRLAQPWDRLRVRGLGLRFEALLQAQESGGEGCEGVQGLGFRACEYARRLGSGFKL